MILAGNMFKSKCVYHLWLINNGTHTEHLSVNIEIMAGWVKKDFLSRAWWHIPGVRRLKQDHRVWSPVWATQYELCPK